MKKVVLISLALLLVPFLAMATMMPITDSQMDEVTAQRGITIAPIDVNLDLRIENIAYTDSDVGVQMIAGIPNPYVGGTINISGLQIDNLHATLAGVIVTDGGGNVDLGPGIGFASVFAEPIDIDVETYANVPLVALRDCTAVVIGLPDLSLTIDLITIGDITFDAGAADVSVGGFDVDSSGVIGDIAGEEGILNPATGQFDFTFNTVIDPTHSIGLISIAGLKLRTFAHVGGIDPGTGAPINPGHRGVIIIKAH